MAELRINDISAGPAGGRRVEVTWREGRARRVAVAQFGDPPDEGGGERVRWYLEDYAEFPSGPAPVIAREAEAQLARAGADLFRQVFSDPDAAEIWGRARDRLGEVRVEVDTDPGQGPGLAWELLRDPGTDAPVALGAGAFVRTHLRAAGHPGLPEPAGDRLRVLLVIARPGGSDDVPFRSAASRLVRGGVGQMGGLDLDALRPATFERLAEVLRAAKDAGRPYHVVHFDGHGTWLDLEDFGFTPRGTGGSGGSAAVLTLSRDKHGVSVAGPVRAGQHGYLLFEDLKGMADRRGTEIQQLVDGPTLGRLLADAGVPVLVLSACRSAYTEARDQLTDTAEAEPGNTAAATAIADGDDVLTGDVHARTRWSGPLAAEVADAGVPAVVAMRYNVDVVTEAQFMADLYAHLLAGKPLGEAAAAARRALAADPVRQVGAVPVSLQDWAVPVVYESAPLVLVRPRRRVAPLVKLSTADTKTDGSGAGGMPPPAAGFFGRDETLLALDRAFDTHPIVLLHAFAGAGKSATAAEFARWYLATGGLDHPDHPEWGPGPILWSSFEHHLTADQVIGTAGDCFAELLEANGIQWAAVTDPARRRNLVLQVLQQVPTLWVWDNVEPVTGFPAGTPSDWAPAEQDDLAKLLRDLAQHTRCKVLVTSRRDEHTWLGELPLRAQLPPMPMRASLQLAGALAAWHGHTLAGADWRALLRYAVGNPLTITVLISQALRAGLSTTEAIEAFVAALEAAAGQLEAGEDAALGRARSLAASLSYGSEEAFTEADRARLAVLHLFRHTVSADALRYLGNQGTLGQDAVPELDGLDQDAAIALLDRAVGIGLLESLGRWSEFYRIHPALPWYFAALFTTSYGPPDSPPAQRAARAYTRALGDLGNYYTSEAIAGHEDRAVPVLGAEEANLRHALSLARTSGLWRAAVGCLQGLRLLYERTGRDGEWARLVAAVTPDFTDPGTGGPLPGRDDWWSVITEYRVLIARQGRDWPAAATLQTALIAWERDRAAAALAIPRASLTPLQRIHIRSLAVSLEQLGRILSSQGDPGCLPFYQEAVGLYERIGSRLEEANLAVGLGNAYLDVPGMRDLGQAERWCQRSLSLRARNDHLGRVWSLGSLGGVAFERFDDARAAGEAASVLLEHLNAALGCYQQALSLTPPDDHQTRAIGENHLGRVYGRAGDTRQALRHYKQALQHNEARGDIYATGKTRSDIALLLAEDGWISDALRHAHAALDNYQQAGPGAAADVGHAQRLIAELEQRSH